MTILDCCISLKMIKKNLVVFGVVDIRQLLLTLFLPGEGGISPLIVCHVTKSVRNRVNKVLIKHKKCTDKYPTSFDDKIKVF